MKFAEFFAGVGLVREGLSLSGWECIWANDISESKKNVYVSNYGDEHFILEDIWNIASKPSLVSSGAFLYTASFPCTDLSVAGGRAGLAGKESGTLNAFLKILSLKKQCNDLPKVVMLENVKGFLTSHDGRDVADTVSALNELGYYVDIVELDAVYFTPQSRPRVFVIAVNSSLADYFMKTGDDYGSNISISPIRSANLIKVIKKNIGLNWGLLDVPIPDTKTQNISSIIDSTVLDSAPEWWSEERKNKLYAQMSDAHKNELAKMVSGQEYSYGTVYRRMRKGQSMAELRTDGIAGCLRTPRGGSSKQIVIKAGKGDWSVRLLNPREYARLQGVRDSYQLPSNENQGFFAMGDAVCVPVINYLATHVLTPLYKQWSTM